MPELQSPAVADRSASRRHAVVLHVPACPHVTVLVDRLREIDPDADVKFVCVNDDADAMALGMAGSPTLVIDGRRVGDAEQVGMMACRVRVPSVLELRRWITGQDETGLHQI